jgi:replicative superfamily II helicase/intein/homing endonuclease
MKIKVLTQDPTINLVLDTLEKKKQAIVFANTKRSAEKCAEDIATKIKIKNTLFDELSERSLKSLSSPTKQCRRLSDCLKKGIAFHHAGLTHKQKELVEDNFREGIIKVICSTPTLAYGLDLPAYRVILKDLRRFSHRGLQFIPVLEYLQMCLPYEEKIITNKGIIPIGQIVEQKIKCDVLSFDVKNKKTEFRSIKDYFIRESSELIELITEKGSKLRLTPEHPLFVDEKWITAKNVKKGDKIFFSTFENKYNEIPSFFDFFINRDVYVDGMSYLITKVKSKFNKTDKELSNLLNINHKMIYSYKNNKKNIPLKVILLLLDLLKVNNARGLIKRVKTKYGSFVNIPEKIDEDFMWLIGIIATDGNVQQTFDKRTGSEYIKIRVFNTNKKIIDKSKSILEKLIFGKVYINKREDGLYVCEIGSTLLARILKDNFGIPFKNKTKSLEIPSFLLNAPLNIIGAYLTGVFDGGGSYTVTKHKKFSLTDSQRILFVTASKNFAKGIYDLLLRMGIVPKFYCETKHNKVILHGKEVKFTKPRYYVTFHQKKFIELFSKYTTPVKCKINATYKDYPNLKQNYENKKSPFAFKVIYKKTLKFSKKIKVYNLKIKNNENYFASGFLVHNCGRAGRPKFDNKGEAVAVCISEENKKQITDKYIYGLPESIESKLAVEPVLRMYLLSLIATNFVNTKQDIFSFFEKTFWAFQFGDMERLKFIIEKILNQLIDWKFVLGRKQETDFQSADEISNLEYKPSLIGKRIAELYVDPLTAYDIVKALKKASNIELKSFSFLHIVSDTLEMRPLLKVKVKEYEDIQSELNKYNCNILKLEPNLYDSDYEGYLDGVKTALMLQEWIDEKGEEYLLEKYNVRPGELRVKIDRANWLLYATDEIARILKLQIILKDIRKTRARLKHGIKEELLTLIKLKDIGRVRARKMFNNGIKDISDVKKSDFVKLIQLIGKNTAIKVKKEVGEKIPEGIKITKRKGQMSLSKYE